MMYQFETEFAGRGCLAVCGIDEAGCGPLAGPVYAAAVILDPNDPIEGLNDSKKLSEKKRLLLDQQIRARARAFAIATASAQEIDELNILQARLLAMRRAVAALAIMPDMALVDGNRDPQIPDVQTLCIVKGDSKSASVAAASILAKVARDAHMLQLAQQYPQYLFEVHKGYPTKKHIELLLQHGPCPAHRQSFLKKIYARSGK